MGEMLSTLVWPTVALASGALLLAPLGVEVLRRGIVFVDLAIAQGAALFALFAQLRWHEAASALAVTSAGVVGALVTAGLVRWLAGRREHGREAAIGLLYVAGASAGLLASAHDPHGTAHFTHLLAADVLWADRGQALTLGVLALAVVVLARQEMFATRDGLFYTVLGLAVAPALMALGLYAVFALLIAPALWAQVRGSRGWRAVVSATGFAVAASLGALLVSALLDTPSGATVAASVALLGLLPTIRHHGTEGSHPKASQDGRP
ncbi:MAG: metal ABC transporter permease [Casimicrobiaceae bacterium]